MSASKARMAAEIAALRAEADAAHRLVVRLLRCAKDAADDGVELSDDLAGIPQRYWRQA